MKSHLNQGFTLLETLTSIAILTLTIIGPLAVIMGSSSYARQTKDVMTATYLAEEAFELLGNQYDTLYIFCSTNPSDTYCAPQTAEETPGEVAWRLFKTRFTAIDGNPSCYINNNPSGCAYDYIDMTQDATATPVRYSASDNECLYLAGMTSTISRGQDEDESITKYVCKGVPAHAVGQFNGAQYKRTITLEKLPADFELALPENEQYNDDIRAVATVNFRGANGIVKSIILTRFFHARP